MSRQPEGDNRPHATPREHYAISLCDDLDLSISMVTHWPQPCPKHMSLHLMREFKKKNLYRSLSPFRATPVALPAHPDHHNHCTGFRRVMCPLTDIYPIRDNIFKLVLCCTANQKLKRGFSSQLPPYPNIFQSGTATTKHLLSQF